jgi:nitroimidazol reductase NimA-like FMN-containing flavoprotein (pyridoxamine 5'-phosphate oxidase superfamily)
MENLSELRNLFSSQLLAVLATHGKEGTYANLVAFAITEDLRHIVFATPRRTLKYSNVSANPAVAMLVDSRANQETDFREAIAVTVVGQAAECAGHDRERLMDFYLRKHPNLAAFVAEEDTALMQVTV